MTKGKQKYRLGGWALVAKLTMGSKWLNWLDTTLVIQISRYLPDFTNEDLIYLDLLSLHEI